MPGTGKRLDEARSNRQRREERERRYRRAVGLSLVLSLVAHALLLGVGPFEVEPWESADRSRSARDAPEDRPWTQREIEMVQLTSSRAAASGAASSAAEASPASEAAASSRKDGERARPVAVRATVSSVRARSEALPDVRELRAAPVAVMRSARGARADSAGATAREVDVAAFVPGYLRDGRDGSSGRGRAGGGGWESTPTLGSAHCPTTLQVPIGGRRGGWLVVGG